MKVELANHFIKFSRAKTYTKLNRNMSSQVNGLNVVIVKVSVVLKYQNNYLLSFVGFQLILSPEGEFVLEVVTRKPYNREGNRCRCLVRGRKREGRGTEGGKRGRLLLLACGLSLTKAPSGLGSWHSSSGHRDGHLICGK